MLGSAALPWLALAVAACAPVVEKPTRSTLVSSAAVPLQAMTRSSTTEDTTRQPPIRVAEEPKGQRLTLAEARRYMLTLINRDRVSEGLSPVVLDEGAATRAGQAHAEDMARNGYLGHWGIDGSVPEQRFTEAGGTDMVLENASCFADEKRRALDQAPRIDPKNVELTESMFFHEKPPHDGHRKNILKPWHKRVGIGIAQPLATPTEIPTPCFAQEFVDPYGAYASAPAKLSVGELLHVEGSIAPPATFAGIGLARVDEPKPVPVSEVNRRRSYPVPVPYQMYWPPGYQTPIPVSVKGNRFRLDLPVSDGGRTGMYELSIWASLPGAEELVMVSLRTMRVTQAR